MHALNRLLRTAQGTVLQTFRFPALVLVAALALLAAALVSFVAIRSGGEVARDLDLTGAWRIGFDITAGPDPARFRRNLPCKADLEQSGTALSGKMECDALGSTTSLAGFLFRESDEVRIAAPFAGSEVEWLGDILSPAQMSGTWNDARGFSGRFVAVRDRWDSTPTPPP